MAPTSRDPRSPRRPRRSVWLLAALAAGAALGCRAPPRERLVVGAVRLPPMAPVYVAGASGCLGGDGPEIVIRDFATGRDALAAMRAGEIEVAAAYATPVVLGAFEDPSLRILTALHTGVRSTHLAARADRGIRDAADLRGKRIGVARRTNAEFFLRALLRFEGIDPSEVALVDLAPADAAEALKAGSVDAVALWSPLVDDAAEALPPDVRVELYSDVYAEASMLVTTEATRLARAAALRKLVGCVVAAVRAIEAAPDGGYALGLSALGEPDAPRLATTWRGVTHQVGLGNALLSMLTQEAEWLRSLDGEPAQDPVFTTLFAPEFLEATAPESLTYLR